MESKKKGIGVSKGNLGGLVSEKVGENQEDGSGADLGRQVCAKMGEQQKRGSCVRSRPSRPSRMIPSSVGIHK